MEPHRLPKFKSLLLCSIKSCIIEEQLVIAGKMVDLFQVAFAETVQKEEMGKHLIDLFDAWHHKAYLLGVNRTICRV